VTGTFIDASALIAATRGSTPTGQRATDIIDDADRILLASDFVRLEVLPKAIFHGRTTEAEFYDAFFGNPLTELAMITSDLIQQAFAIAARWNLNAVDALHVAAAMQMGADEFVTAERPTSSLSRVAEPGLTIISIRSEREGLSEE
jgi:predicted nucleic acid-binding protein